MRPSQNVAKLEHPVTTTTTNIKNCALGREKRRRDEKGREQRRRLERENRSISVYQSRRSSSSERRALRIAGTCAE